MRFRKKPIEVEAYQTKTRTKIHTLEGDLIADVGDWIITGIKGEQYPVKHEIFMATYDSIGMETHQKLHSFREGLGGCRWTDLRELCREALELELLLRRDRPQIADEFAKIRKKLLESTPADLRKRVRLDQEVCKLLNAWDHEIEAQRHEAMPNMQG